MVLRKNNIKDNITKKLSKEHLPHKRQPSPEMNTQLVWINKEDRISQTNLANP